MNVMSSVLWLSVVRDCYLLVATIAGGCMDQRESHEVRYVGVSHTKSATDYIGMCCGR